MSTKSFKQLTLSVAAAAVALFFTPLVPEARAASIVCPVDVGFSAPIWDNVTPNTGTTGCELGGSSNDQPGPAIVNGDSMFDISTWQVLQDELDVNATDGELSWAASLFNGKDIGALMLVLKGPNENSVVDLKNYVGYLLKLGTTSVSFDSPFRNPNSGNAMEVSHYTVYWSGSNTTTQVPEPATLALFGSAALALAARRRFRRG